MFDKNSLSHFDNIIKFMIRNTLLFFGLVVFCLAKEHPEAKLYFTDYCR